MAAFGRDVIYGANAAQGAAQDHVDFNGLGVTLAQLTFVGSASGTDTLIKVADGTAGDQIVLKGVSVAAAHTVGFLTGLTAASGT